MWLSWRIVASIVSLYTFLGLNGTDFDASEHEVVRVITAPADGTLDEEGLAEWVWSRARSSLEQATDSG
jgi:prophage maintenance system killer protein